MKTDVSNIQLSQTRKLSYAEFALIAIVLFCATKFCTLPSVLTGAAGSKAIWVVALLLAIESITLFFATKIAKSGGLFRLGFKKPLLFLFAALYMTFFLLKLSAFTREIGSYYALSLFENVPVLPIASIYLVACVLFAIKGYAGVGRVLEVFMWLFVFVFLFILILTTTKGNFFNALAMVNPDFGGFGKGIRFAFAWFGDAAVVCFADLSGSENSAPAEQTQKRPSQGRQTANESRSEPPREGDRRGEERNDLEGSEGENAQSGGGENAKDPQNKGSVHGKKKIAFAAIFFSLALLLVFYAVFISVYGDAAKSTDFAFIKLSAFKANADELGSADWPVILLWAIGGVMYLSLVFLSGKECLCFLRNKTGTKSEIFCFALLGVAALAISTTFLDEEGDYTAFMTKILNVAAIAISCLTIALGAFAIKQNKEKTK